MLGTLVVGSAGTVAANQELTIDYTGGGVNQLWFEPRSKAGRYRSEPMAEAIAVR